MKITVVWRPQRKEGAGGPVQTAGSRFLGPAEGAGIRVAGVRGRVWDLDDLGWKLLFSAF